MPHLPGWRVRAGDQRGQPVQRCENVSSRIRLGLNVDERVRESGDVRVALERVGKSASDESGRMSRHVAAGEATTGARSATLGDWDAMTPDSSARLPFVVRVQGDIELEVLFE